MMNDFEKQVRKDIDEIITKVNILTQAIHWMTHYNILNDPHYQYTIDTLREKMNDEIIMLRSNAKGDEDEL